MAEYEKLRQQKLEENKKKIEELKLAYLSVSLRQSPLKPSTPTKHAKRRKVEPKQGELVVLRRSSRVANLPETHYKEEPTYFYVERTKRSCKRKLDDRVYASDEARAYATEKAEHLMDEFGSAYPSFVKPMLQSHTTGGFWLGLPRYFCTKYLPKKDSTITLEDENGEESDTNYLAQKNGLSAGWRGFSLDHDLVDGDALVFQLVKPTKFKVHIVRASEYDDA